ncbi:hypothetical protein [Paenibacillus sp. YYML68]|uniref:hypothetical protein n=1 Tax=Paenibacillus sp. YYML68 TaxID=2909250 RepID=UPI0024913171|nr:hypothetical protein [Paenibacillus sp. YYML68]
MSTEVVFNNQKIPVSFVSCDQKAIPQLIRALKEKGMYTSLAEGRETIERIELIGNSAVLHHKTNDRCIELPLY